MKDYTFANGMTIPRGTTIATPAYPIQHDPEIYPNPHEFDPFRFARLREEIGAEAKYHAGNTSTEFLHFGHGQHAWYVPRKDGLCSPGRFFAINEIKLLLAFLILRYDLKAKDGKRPEDMKFTWLLLPNQTAELLLRKRQQTADPVVNAEKQS
jgi:cytochrome P450